MEQNRIEFEIELNLDSGTNEPTDTQMNFLRSNDKFWWGGWRALKVSRQFEG